MGSSWILGLTLLVCIAHGASGAGPLCYSCFHYSRAANGENLQAAFSRDFRRLASTMMGVFKNTGTIDGSTPSLEVCKNASEGMTTRRCATGQKCLSYTHAWKSSHYKSLSSRDQWLMTWRDCVDATFDCDSSPMDTLDATCCTTDRCNTHRYNGDALLANAKK